MKAAIYSRVMEEDQWNDVQLFFDELGKQKIEPVIFQQYYQQLKDKINLPADTKTFSFAEDLNEEIEFIISLGGDGTLVAQSITVSTLCGMIALPLWINASRLF